MDDSDVAIAADALRDLPFVSRVNVDPRRNEVTIHYREGRGEVADRMRDLGLKPKGSLGEWRTGPDGGRITGRPR